MVPANGYFNAGWAKGTKVSAAAAYAEAGCNVNYITSIWAALIDPCDGIGPFRGVGNVKSTAAAAAGRTIATGRKRQT
jgi:hypothetical protein